MAEQRLPIVDGDDGVWGDILRQYLMKEHYNTDLDNPENGGHQNVTIRAGTSGAGGAPLKITTGTLLISPEAGAIEFAGDHFYLTSTTGPVRRKIAAYDDTSGATGDIYYRSSGGTFTRLGIGSANDVLTVNSGIPSWQAPTGGSTMSDAAFTLQDNTDATKQLKFELSGITAGQTRTLTVPDASTTVVGTDVVQTLTNKTIDVDNSTVTNIEVDNFKATAIVTETEGIGANDNDTTLPTSAAVKDYVDNTAGVALTVRVAASDASADIKAIADYVCDGTADQTEINAAIASLATGGKVELSRGTFTTTAAISLANGISLVGQGYATKIVLANSQDHNGIVASAKNNFAVADLYIDGNKSNHTWDSNEDTQNGIYLINSSRGKITNVWANNCTASGITLGQDNTYIVVDSCHTDANVRNGIYLWYSDNNNNIISNNVATNSTDYHGIAASDSFSNTITGNTCTGNQFNGIDLDGDSAYNTVSGNTCSDNTGRGIVLRAEVGTPNRNTVSGNTCQNNGKDGIQLDGAQYNVVVGNIIHGNSQETPNFYAGILINYETTYSHAINNTVTANVITGGHGYALAITDAAATGNRALNNDFTGNNATYIDSSNTLIQFHNKGVDTSTVEDLLVKSTASMGSGGYIDNNKVLNIDHTVVPTTDTYGLFSMLREDASASNGNYHFGGYIGAQIKSGNSQNYTGGIRGANIIAEHAGTGTLNQANSIEATTTNSSSGTISNAIGVHVNAPTNTGGGTITEYDGILIETPTTPTNKRALRTTGGDVVLNDFMADADFSVRTDNDFNTLFIEGSSDRVGIGTGGPQAKLDVNGEIRASTAGTNTASVVTVGGTQALTNKRLTPRVTSVSNTTPWTINTDSFDVAINTGLTANLTVNATTGTPTDGQRLQVSITGTAARTITWTTASAGGFEASTTALPTTTVGTTRLDTYFVWNATTSRWRVANELPTTLYRSGGTDVSVADGGTGRSTSTTAYGIIAAGTTATGALQTIAPGTSGQFLKSAGASALGSFASITAADITGTTAQFNTALSDGDFATLAGSEALTNKTLTDARFNTIKDTAGQNIISLNTASTSVNNIGVGNAATGQYPFIYVGGTDTNVGLDMMPQGNGPLRIYTTTGNTPTLAAAGADTNLNLNLTAKGTGTVKANGADIVNVSGSQTLTNKTLTDPRIVNNIRDTNGNPILEMSPQSSSSVNYFRLWNKDTGDWPELQSMGTDTNIGMFLTPKGTGPVAIWAQDSGVTGVTVQAHGVPTNLHVNLVPKGTGRVQANGVNIPTINSTDTLTNKTIDVDNNTVSNLEVDNFKGTAIVTVAEGLATSDNDTSIPTTAAVKDYVDNSSGGGSTSTRIVQEAAVGLGAVASVPSATTTATGTSRLNYRISVNCVGVRLVYVNYHETGTGHAVDANDLVIGGASVWLSGTGYRVTFNNGSNGVTIKPGGYAITDPLLSLDLPADTLIETRTYVSGTWHPNRYANGPGMGGWTATTDLSAPGSGAIADNTSFQYLIGPVAIYGNPTGSSVKTVFSIGDSIMWGMHDGPSGAAGINSTYDRMGGGGFAARAARTANFSLLNAGIGGQSAQVFASLIGHHRTMSFVGECQTALDEYGRNDLFAGRTLAQLQGDIITIWNLLAARGLRTFRTTLVPDTTSTDGWITTTNQTVKAWETNRVNFNDWLRDGAPMSSGAAVAVGTVGAARCSYYDSSGVLVNPASGPAHPIYGVIETADTVESSRNSGKWVVPYASRTITDGQSSTNGSVITSPAQAAFNLANDIGKVAVFTGAGTAGGVYVGTIKNVFSGTQVSVTPNTPTAVASGGTVHIIDAATFDGVHPHPSAHAAMAVPIAAVAATDFI